MLILLFSNGVFAFLLDKTREKRVIFIWFHACIFKSLLLLLLLLRKKKKNQKQTSTTIPPKKEHF
jgi:hypothetical protein